MATLSWRSGPRLVTRKPAGTSRSSGAAAAHAGEARCSRSWWLSQRSSGYRAEPGDRLVVLVGREASCQGRVRAAEQQQ